METWKKVKGYTYEVSDLGRIRNMKTNKILRPFDRSKYGPELLRGYLTVHMTDGHGKYKNKTVHSIVMETFVCKRPKGLVINHKNGKRGDNRLSNLEYCTQSENRKEDFRLGRQSLTGEKNTQSVLTAEDVLLIRASYPKESVIKMSKYYGVKRSCIYQVLNKITWKHIL